MSLTWEKLTLTYCTVKINWENNQFIANYEYVTIQPRWTANMELTVIKFNLMSESAHSQLWVLRRFHRKQSDSSGSQVKQLANRLNQDWSRLVSWIQGNSSFFTISNHEPAIAPNCKARYPIASTNLQTAGDFSFPFYFSILFQS